MSLPLFKEQVEGSTEKPLSGVPLTSLWLELAYTNVQPGEWGSHDWLRLVLSKLWPPGHIVQPLSKCFLQLPNLRLKESC